MTPEDIQAYESGESLTDLAARLFLDPRTVRKQLRTAGVEIRDARARGLVRSAGTEAVSLKAVESLVAEGYEVEAVGRDRVSWTCPAGHQREQSAYDVLRNFRCARCARFTHTPRKALEVQVGQQVGDLVCLEYLGVVDGHSRVRVRNQTNGREAVMVTNQFLGGKWKLLDAKQRREISSAANQARRGIPNPKNARFTFGDLRKACQDLGLEFLHPDIQDGEALRDITDSGIWEFRCHCTRTFKPSINNVRQGNTTSCGCVKSRPQMEILDLVRSWGLRAETSRGIIAPLELDVWIPDLKIGIEYCGLYWHGEKHGGLESRGYHLRKLRACEAAGIRLITIFEDEWLLRRPAVEAYLQAILSRKSEVLGARSCEVVWDDPGALELIRTWHLQGKSGGRVVGLRRSGRWVAAMVFNRPNVSRAREAKPGVYELGRFVVAPGVSVPGGASRLLKSFWKETPAAQELISYSDLRWSAGNLYQRLGFENQAVNPPSFWYFQTPDLRRKHRFGLRASVVRKWYPGEPGTAWEVLLAHGWDRIWDCGTIRWVLSRPL